MKNKFIFLAIVLLTTVFANASNGSYKIRYEEIKCSIQNSSQSTNLNMDKISDMKFTMPITIMRVACPCR
ncbi:MAG: hypothetical protein RIR12_2153 [Bacteroidota bacterium]|jgi:hypothetical protein